VEETAEVLNVREGAFADVRKIRVEIAVKVESHTENHPYNKHGMKLVGSGLLGMLVLFAGN
jgi:hypothetical protein